MWLVGSFLFYFFFEFFILFHEWNFLFIFGRPYAFTYHIKVWWVLCIKPITQKRTFICSFSRGREGKPTQTQVAKVAANVFFGLGLVSFVRSFVFSFNSHFMLLLLLHLFVCLFVHFVIMILNLLKWTRLTFSRPMTIELVENDGSEKQLHTNPNWNVY